LLSQPAVSRALQGAPCFRMTLGQVTEGFELTLRGRKILDELEGLLPKMERLVATAAFDPVLEKSLFRISGPGNVCTVVLPRLCHEYADGRCQVNLSSTLGRAASRSRWSTGIWILYSTLMMGSCRRNFSRKGFIARIGFAPFPSPPQWGGAPSAPAHNVVCRGPKT
jgi:hypothetical protein